MTQHRFHKYNTAAQLMADLVEQSIMLRFAYSQSQIKANFKVGEGIIKRCSFTQRLLLDTLQSKDLQNARWPLFDFIDPTIKRPQRKRSIVKLS